MATVWLAHDLKHDRSVAVKVLHPQLAAHMGAERFLKEIRTTAQLQHSHILPLFDSGDADGLLYYVMPYVKGESLRQRISREQRLPMVDAVRISAEIAGALDHAHRHGVIHRDIKPENILLNDGQALVADFGIALSFGVGDGRLTETGLSLGTPAYMSPEQALGERELDARTDVYALGALTYEMLTGAPPFSGGTAQAVVAKVITERPVPPSKLRSDIPQHVDRAILRALQKTPADRFAGATEFQDALTHSSRSHGAGRSRRVPVRAAAVVMVGIAAVALVSYLATHRGEHVAQPVALSIAAVPFDVQDTADRYLGDQLPSEILDALTHVPGLTVRPLASAGRFRSEHNLAAMASALNVGTLLTGSVAREGRSIRVTARLYDAVRDRSLPAVSFTNGAEQTFALEDSVSTRIVASFRLTQTEAQLADARAGRTTNPAAHDTLMLAQWYTEQRTPHGLSTAIALFRTAIRLDSTYADAWAGMANALNMRAIFGDSSPTFYFPEAKRDLLHALQLDSSSAYAHTQLGVVKVFYDRDYAGAGAEFAKATALDSTLSAAPLFRSWYYLGSGRVDSSIISMRRAWTMDPASLIAGTRLGSLFYFADSVPAAERQLETVLKIDKTFRFAQTQLAQVYADDNRCGEAFEILPSSPWPPGSPEDAMTAYVWARCGRLSMAKQYADSIETRAREGLYVNSFFFATVYAAMHDRDAMYRWLNTAVASKDWALFELRVHPAFREWREEPEFRELERRAGV